MKKELTDLLDAYRNGGLSRRQLAVGLSAATATLAGGGALGAAAVPASQSGLTSNVPGAVGGGADDFQPIQAAIDQVGAAGGGQVIIDQPLQTGTRLTMKTGVELVGCGRFASSISAHPTMTHGSLIRVEDDAHDVRFAGLTLDSGGLCSRALIEAGAGCHRIRVTDARLTGWDLATPAVCGVYLEAPPDPGGSDSVVREVLVDGCEFDSIGNGVKIAEGASHVSVLNSHFSDVHRRAVRVLGPLGGASRHVRIVGNTVVDFPQDPDMSNPFLIGTLGSTYHEYLQIVGNVIVGNGDYFGPGGFGTADHFSLHCTRYSNLTGNVSIDSGESGFAMLDCSDIRLEGNWSVSSDVAGFALKALDSRVRRVQFVGNHAHNNGQNRGGNTPRPFVQSGFLLRDFGQGIVDTHFLGNYAWDDQVQKTQKYAVALEHSTIHNTRLTGNFWRASLHALGTIYNRGLGTYEASYDRLPVEP